jgi:predicted HTH domain antitoxin
VKELKIKVPDELAHLIGSNNKAKKEAKEALVFDLVRKGRISKAKAAELLDINLWDLPKVLAKYRIPWFDYDPKELKKDLKALKKYEKAKGTTK